MHSAGQPDLRNTGGIVLQRDIPLITLIVQRLENDTRTVGKALLAANNLFPEILPQLSVRSAEQDDVHAPDSPGDFRYTSTHTILLLLFINST